MRNNLLKKELVWTIIVIFIGVAIAPSINTTSLSVSNYLNDEIPIKPFYIRHRQIVINGNNDLKLRNGVVRGTGTKENPYIISGWKFDGTFYYNLDVLSSGYPLLILFFYIFFGITEAAITIRNTDKYIIIRNNYFVNWREPTPPPNPYGPDDLPNHRAIDLVNTKNIVIENNIISECNEGIWVYSSTSSTIIRNNIFSSISGGWKTVQISGGDTLIEHNDFQDIDMDVSCIHFLFAGNNIMINNNSIKNSDGYTIIGENGLIENNILDNCDIAIKVGNSIVRNNLVKSSTIGIASFAPNSISHNELISNNVGVGCYWPSHVLTITDNIIQGNNWGIFCIEDMHPSVHNNNIYENGVGFKYNGGSAINATLNWWGAANGPSGYGPGDGDAVDDDIIYEPWLSSPNPDAGRQ